MFKYHTLEQWLEKIQATLFLKQRLINSDSETEKRELAKSIKSLAVEIANEEFEDEV